MVILTPRIRRPNCPRCDMSMAVGRRQPHPAKFGDYEVVVFNCLMCRTQAPYEMDEHGVLTPYVWPDG